MMSGHRMCVMWCFVLNSGYLCLCVDVWSSYIRRESLFWCHIHVQCLTDVTLYDTMRVTASSYLRRHRHCITLHIDDANVFVYRIPSHQRQYHSFPMQIVWFKLAAFGVKKIYDHLFTSTAIRLCGWFSMRKGILIIKFTCSNNNGNNKFVLGCLGQSCFEKQNKNKQQQFRCCTECGMTRTFAALTPCFCLVWARSSGFSFSFLAFNFFLEKHTKPTNPMRHVVRSRKWHTCYGIFGICNAPCRIILFTFMWRL